MSYSWTINSIDYDFDVDGFVNVATSVNWTISKEDTVANTVYTAEIDGETGLNYSNLDANTFVSWDSLTQNTVVEWIESTMGTVSVETLKNTLDTKISLQVTPVSSSGLPWE